MTNLLFFQRVQQLSGWRRNALAFICGVAMTLTLPPVYLLPLLIPAFTLLYLLIDSAPNARRAFADGWWWGLGWHMTGLYWFCIALLTDPEKFAWLIPFCLFGLNAIIALYAGVACWLWKKTNSRGLIGIFIFSVIWIVVEYARGHLFSGFPWNLAGYSFNLSDALLQMASLVGIYGLTWFAVLLGVIPAALYDARIPKKHAIVAIAILYVSLLSLFAWGSQQIQTAERYQNDIKLRLIQANIEQNLRWDPAYRRHVVDEHIKLTQSPGIENITAVIWPETSVPFALQSKDMLTHIFGQMLPPKTRLVAGAMRTEGTSDDWKMFNSIFVIDHKGDITLHYDKVRLVPFGEFLPFRNLLPKSWLTPVGEKDFSAGRPGITLELPDQKHAAMPLICYEAIFPEMTMPNASAATPTWLLNITNDAWFGQSSGPYQHFEMARVRAVEQGLPLVRVANTGISGVVDAYGRVLGKIDLGQKGYLDSLLPAAKPAHTLYYSLQEQWLIVLMVLALILRISQRKSENN